MLPVKDIKAGVSSAETLMRHRTILAEKQLERFKGDGEVIEQFQELDRFPIKKVREAQGSGITLWDYSALGSMLQKQRDYEKFAEDVGSLNALGQLPMVSLGTTTAVYGASPLMAFCSVQPMDDERGLIYYQSTVAQNSRGNVDKNDKLLDSLALPDAFPNGYASNTKIGEVVLNVTSGAAATYENLQLGEGKEYTTPIRVQTMRVYGTAVYGSNTVTYPVMNVDLDSGKFSGGAQDVDGNIFAIVGSVDFSTGRINTMTFAPSAPTGAVHIYADYETLAEAGEDLPAVQTIFQTKDIKARLFALKSTLGIPQAFQLEKKFGISGADLLAKNLQTMLINEQCNIAIALLAANVPTYLGDPISWERKVPTGASYSSYERKMTLEDAMNDTSENLLRQAGRGSVNVWIVGRKAATILAGIPGFVKLYNENAQGPHIFGTFKGQIIIRVPFDAILDPMRMIGIMKGDNPFDAAIVYSPYMPYVMTGLLPNGVNPLMNQRGIATWAGLDILVANLITQMYVTQDPTFAY